MADLTFRNVKKFYDGKPVIHGLDLDIQDGHFVVIVGPSGCGKSTLLRMVAGLEAICAGEITVNGRIVNHVEPRDRGCAMVFQNYALYPHMTVRQNIGFPLRIANMPKGERERRVLEVATVLDLSDHLDRRPAQLSGGQRQRVAIGRAMVREPVVFLFDEPMSNLDAKLRLQMRTEIRRLHKRLKVTSIFVTHDQVEAMTLADTLVVMSAGKIEQIGTPAAVYRHPASRFVAAFLGAPAMNLVEVTTAGPDRVTLDGAPGIDITAPSPLPAAGSKLTLGIRPEDIAVTGDPDNGLPGRIDLIEELGDRRVACCQSGGAEFTVVLPRGSPETEGARIGLQFPPQLLHFFDPLTGKRIPDVRSH